MTTTPGKWRQLFVANIPPHDPECVGPPKYEFGAPATATQVAAVETMLGRALPGELRELLAEFDGVVAHYEHDDDWHEDAAVFLSTAQMLEDVPEYLRVCGDQAPAADEIARVVFIAQRNGFAQLYALCVEPFGRYTAGQVLGLDSEAGAFESTWDNLDAFMRTGPKDGI